MIKQILEKLDKEEQKKYNRVVKVAKMAVDSKSIVKLDWDIKSSFGNNDSMDAIGTFNGGAFRINIENGLITLSYQIMELSDTKSDWLTLRIDDSSSELKSKLQRIIRSFDNTLRGDRNEKHYQFNTYKEIEKAVKSGKKVYWGNDNYILNWEVSAKRIGVLSKSNNNFTYLGDKEYDIIRCFTKDGK